MALPRRQRAGIAFPGNDWMASPGGDDYLANIGGTPELEAELLVLQTAHRNGVVALLEAIAGGRVDAFLQQFSCPTPGASSRTLTR